MAVLSKLLEEISYECVRGTLDREISDIVYDSRKVMADCLFVCIAGAKADGHRYAAEAAKAGAAAILVQRWKIRVTQWPLCRPPISGIPQKR